MNTTLGHTVLASAQEFFNYQLINELAAYSNKTVTLYPYTDTRFNTLAVYGSPYAQWVYHGEVAGVTVPSGVSSTGFISRGTDGLALDFKNGRALFSGTQTGLTLTANVSVAEINTYVTTKSDSQIVGETNFLTLPINQAATSYLAPDSTILPALFFKSNETQNYPLAVGGTDWTSYKIRVIAIMKNNFQLTAVGDMVRDSKDRIFPLLTGTPLNEYNDLRAGWNYASELANPSSYAFIDRANFAYLQNDTFAKNNPTLEVGIGTLDVRIARRPHE